MSIERLRKTKRISQKKLADQMGVRQSTVSSWENGLRFPRKETLEKLCKFFDCKIDDLL